MMKKNKKIMIAEYLSLTLILSYFFIHNIYIVLIGMTFSFYLANINSIKGLIKYINENLLIKKRSKKLSENEKLNNSNPINIKSNNEIEKLSLVETIEELGFIPSTDNDNETNAA
tara:strand:+ start:1580 stop:1924 length:345 start_codon:yes stop_codon:yes gene_type:complete